MNTIAKVHLYASCSAAVLLFATSASAQTVPTPPVDKADLSSTPQTEIAPTLESAPETAADDEAIVVTGSRLKTEYNNATPIQIITPDQVANAGIMDTAGMINRSVAASGSEQVNNRLSATGAGGSVVVGGTNANTIGLRNLTANRTLILLDGRRLTPAGTGSQVGPVDLNVIPSSIIQRVEILTDGASSVYGSDAIAGVVNIIPRKGSKGLEINAYASQTQHGGGNYYQGSLFWGKEFDRGYFNIGAEYRQQERLRVGDRPETSCAGNFVSNPTTGQRVDIRDTSGAFKCRNLNPTGIFFDQTYYGGWFQYDPTLSNANYPAAALTLRGALPDWVRAARGGYPDTYPYYTSDSPAYQDADSISPLKTGSLYLSGAYKITDGIEAYGNMLLNRRVSSSTTWQFLYPILARTNPNNTVGEALVTASGGRSNGNVQPQMNMPLHTSQKINYWQATGGLRGQVGGSSFLSDWDWDVSAQYGRSSGSYSRDFFYNDRVSAASGPDVACNPTLITISAPATCVSIPWLDPRFLVDQNWTPEERAFLQGRETGHTTYDMAGIDGSLSGPLFSLPAGKVQVATGFSIRHQRLNDVPGINAQKGNYFASSTAGITKGSDTVKEIFGEIGIPILADLPLIKRLTLTASGRYTDYSSYGSGETYKLGAAWDVFPALTLRATMGTSFRAPSLYELYLANQTSFFNYVDPCVRYGDNGSATVSQNCAAQGFAPDFQPTTSDILATQGGGLGTLKAETSKNYTYGGVLRVPVANLQIAVDYYNIDVKNEVASFGVSGIVNSCYNSTSFPDNAFCGKIARDPVTHVITTVDNRLVNLAEQHQRGIDVSANAYQQTSFGKIGLTLQWTWTLENSLRRDPSSFEDDNGLSGNPKSTGWAELSMETRKVSFFYGFNYTGPTDDAAYYGGSDIMTYCGGYAGTTGYGNSNDCQQVQEKLRVGAQFIHYASVRWQISDDLRLQAGITNLFDTKPPVEGADAFTYRTGSVPSNLYNLTGRTFFLRAGKTF